MPPRYFGIIISSHNTQAVFLLPSLLPHQNFRTRLVICLHGPLGSLKHDIEYVGICLSNRLDKYLFASGRKALLHLALYLIPYSIHDFSLFTCCPDAWQCSCKTYFTTSALFTLALKNNRLSSAKRR